MGARTSAVMSTHARSFLVRRRRAPWALFPAAIGATSAARTTRWSVRWRRPYPDERVRRWPPPSVRNVPVGQVIDNSALGMVCYQQKLLPRALLRSPLSRRRTLEAGRRSLALKAGASLASWRSASRTRLTMLASSEPYLLTPHPTPDGLPHGCPLRPSTTHHWRAGRDVARAPGQGF